MKNKLIIIFISLFLSLPYYLAKADSEDAVKPKLIIFHSTTCHNCVELINKFMPKVQSAWQGKIDIEYRDIVDVHNYKVLFQLQKEYGVILKSNTMPIAFFNGYFLIGKREITSKLPELLKDSVGQASIKKNSGSADLVERFMQFSPVTIAGAGLIDGINPCAFTVIVFFMSFLALQGYRKRQLAVIGIGFIISVFLTYLFIGLSLFNFIYQLSGFWAVRKAFNVSIGVLSFIFGILAVHDFIKFKKTGKTEDMILQLPKAIKNRIHGIIGFYYRQPKEGPGSSANSQKKVFSLLIYAFITGFLVSLLEAVCTGQVYLPTITFVLKTTDIKLLSFAYLLLYNFMFILPLVIIFIFSLFGATSDRFSVVFKKHFLSLKMLMALLFFALALFLVWKA